MIAHFFQRFAFALCLALATALATAGPAQAQFSESFRFLEAVEKQDGDEVEKLLKNGAPTLINTRKTNTGESALHLTIAARDVEWTRFLLSREAKPDIADNKGNTPLILAAQMKFIDGARLLIAARANVNAANDSGETALIRAVQMRDVDMVRLLVAAGADPDIADSITGQSARDYAAADRRVPALLAAIEAPRAKP